MWSRTATFADPLTVATGYNKFAAQWYGLPMLFDPIELQSHLVTSAKTPIEIDISNKYTLKGLGKSQIINSVVKIWVDEQGKIERVEDRWNSNLPDGPFPQVSRFGLLGRGVGRLVAVVWWGWCRFAWWWPWMVRVLIE